MSSPLERLQALEREDVDTVRFVQALVDAAPDLIAVALAAASDPKSARGTEWHRNLSKALKPLLSSEAPDA